MAKFEVKVVRIDAVEEHPNADRLTLNTIGGYTSISNKKDDGSWRYQAGDLVVYIPEHAVVPESVLRNLNMWDDEKGKGILNGKRGDRVKAIKLRGIFSEGILYPVTDSMHAVVGEDVADLLGITKYEPPIPAHMGGEVFNLGYAPVKFDLEPWEKNIDLIPDGEMVDFREKLHGTFTGFSYIPDLDHPEAFEGLDGKRNIVVYSKGLGSRGLVFKDVPTNDKNLYVQAWKKLATPEFFIWLDGLHNVDPTASIHVLGETYGPGVQDLHYGAKTKEFRVFAVGCTVDREAMWSCNSSVDLHAKSMGAETAPQLYYGPFSEAAMVEARDGKTTFGNVHVREGIVITTADGRYDPEFGFVQLKAVSPAYKLRKGGTELN